MMKRYVLAVILLIFVMALAGCGCRHEWSEADCLAPKRCRICGQREGEALGHQFDPATCESPKTCAVCGETDGTATGHSWLEATCHEPETCADCGKTRGEPRSHEWQSATCARPEICVLCKETRGEAGVHSWVEADCVNPKYCTACAAIERGPLGHSWIEATCDLPKTCSVCAATEGTKLNHSWKKATCTEAQFCRLCGLVGEPALGHSWKEATCVLPISCAYCDATQGAALGHDWEPATPEQPKTCKVCAATEGLPIELDDRFISEQCQPIFGSWQYSQITKAEDLELPGFDQDMVEIITYEFGIYGTLYITTVVEDPQSYKALLAGYRAADIYNGLAEEGLDAEAADAYYMEIHDMTVVEYALWDVEQMDWEADMNICEEWVYYVQDGVLYLAQHWEDEFEAWPLVLEEDQLTLSNEWVEGDLVLTRVSAEEA